MPLAPLNNSVVFKKLFQDPEIVKVFVKDLIGVDLDITADNIELEKQFQPTIGAVDIRIDVFVQDPKHRFVIEIQRQRYDYHYDRFLYYHQVAHIDLIKSYRDYKSHHTVHTIVWMPQYTRDPFLKHSVVTTSLCSMTERGEQLNIYPHRIYFLNPFYINEQTPPGVADWLKLAAESVMNPEHPDINRERPIFERATQLIMDDGITEEERADILQEAGYEENLRIQYEQGMEEGIRNIARTMLAQGVEPSLIAQATGLTADELTALGGGEYHRTGKM